MLSKNNKILIGCLALLLVMSVGYALFSDTITINGSATAKGDFNLVTTCDMDEEVLNEIGVYNMGSSSDEKISCEGNVVSASATLDYPGSTKWFRIMIKNEGTIPAKLKKVVELNNPEVMICESGNCGSQIINIAKNDDNTNSVGAQFFSDAQWTSDYEDVPYGYEPSFYEEILDAVLNPGETAYFYIEMRWDSNSTTPGDPLTASMNVKMDWEQVTE